MYTSLKTAIMHNDYSKVSNFVHFLNTFKRPVRH